MNVSRFHVSCIQETDYRPHFTCDWLLDFLEHCKHTGRCVNAVRLSANGVRAFPKDQHHRDRSAAATIFANVTYFVDTPRIRPTFLSAFQNLITLSITSVFCPTIWDSASARKSRVVLAVDVMLLILLNLSTSELRFARLCLLFWNGELLCTSNLSSSSLKKIKIKQTFLTDRRSLLSIRAS
jgi:hypothetical protein